MFDTIQKIIHQIRTAFGDLDITYGGDDIGDWGNYPKYALHGNICGSAIWTVLSSVIFDTLHKRGFGANITAPTVSKEIFKIQSQLWNQCRI